MEVSIWSSLEPVIENKLVDKYLSVFIPWRASMTCVLHSLTEFPVDKALVVPRGNLLLTTPYTGCLPIPVASLAPRLHLPRSPFPHSKPFAL